MRTKSVRYIPLEAQGKAEGGQRAVPSPEKWTQSSSGAESQSRTNHTYVSCRGGRNLGEDARLSTENRIKSFSHFDVILKRLGDHSYKQWSDILHWA